MDIKDSYARSRNMAAIRSKDTKPEVYFRKLLFSQGFRYRKNVSYVTGHPDIFLARYKTAIFVHGCFWHRHQGCKFAYHPKSRVEFWNTKFQNNVSRDKAVKCELVNQKIKMLIVWECTIKQMQKSKTFESEIMAQVQNFIRSECMYLEL